jgi:galactitol-specific phosphotransferase system IIB component
MPQERNMSASISSLTTTTHVTDATGHLDINASDDQQAVDTTFNNHIDEKDLVMSVAQYDNLVHVPPEFVLFSIEIDQKMNFYNFNAR